MAINFLLNYVYNVGSSLSQLINVVVLFGDPDESLSGRIGKSIRRGGLMARLPWSDWFLKHWFAAIEDEEGGNSALDRPKRI
jgi:hypothetical protein